MLSVSSLIEFLLNLLRSEAAQAEFVADPQGTLTRNGLDGLCGQDVRDVQPLLADHAAVRVKDTDDDSVSDNPVSQYRRGQDDHDDPVREITNITEHYEVTNVVVDDRDEYNYTYVDDRDNIVNVDDRDTTAIHADGDVNIKDSFNQDNDVNVIEDSFNQDNDGVDNKGGTIDDSVVAGSDIEGSLNSDDDTTVRDSFNDDNSETKVDASSHDTAVRDSFNDDNSETVDASSHDTTEIEVKDSYNSEDNDVADVELEVDAAHAPA